MYSSMFHAGDLVQRRCSSCSAAFKHQRTSACSAKKSKKPDRKQKSKTWSETSAPSMPDTASLHLQYARMLDLDPTLAMKRVVEEGLPVDDAFVQQLKENRQSAEDSLKGAKMIAANSSTLYAAEDMKSSIAKSVEEAKAMLQTTTEVLKAIDPDGSSQTATPPRQVKPPSPPDQGLRTSSTQSSQSYLPGSVSADLDEELEAVPKISPKEKMDLYQQMDTLLDSIRDGTFKSNNATSMLSSPTPQAPEAAAPSLAARPELYTSDGPTEAPPSPTMNEYEVLLAAGPRTRGSASDPQPQAPLEPPKPPPPLSSRPSLSTAASRIAEEERQEQAQKEDEARENRAVQLEEKLFQRPDADDEFLSMDTIAAAREQLRAQKLVPDSSGQSSSAPDGTTASGDSNKSPGETAVLTHELSGNAAGSSVADSDLGDQEIVQEPVVVAPLAGPPQKNVERAVATAPSIDDVIQEALGVPSFVKSGRKWKKEKRGKARNGSSESAAVKASKAVLAGKDNAASKALSDMRAKVSKPVPKEQSSRGLAAHMHTTRLSRKAVAGSKLRPPKAPVRNQGQDGDVYVVLKEENAAERLKSVQDSVKKPARKPPVVVGGQAPPDPFLMGNLQRQVKGGGVDVVVEDENVEERLTSVQGAVKKPDRKPVGENPTAPLPSQARGSAPGSLNASWMEARMKSTPGRALQGKPGRKEGGSHFSRVQTLPSKRETSLKTDNFLSSCVKGSNEAGRRALDTGPLGALRDASRLMKQKEMIVARTMMVVGTEGAVVQYGDNPAAVGLLPIPLMSAHTVAQLSAAVAKVAGKEHQADMMDEGDLMRTLEEMESVPLLQQVKVMVQSIDKVSPADCSDLSIMFRIGGMRSGPSDQQASETDESKDFIVMLSEIAAYSDLKVLDVLSPASAALDPLTTEEVMSTESLILEAVPVKDDGRGGSNIVTVLPEHPELRKGTPSLRGVVLESDASDKGLQGILTERKVSELGLEKFVVGVVKHSPVTDGCIPLRWCLSEQDVLACKLVPGNTDSSESVSLTACPEEMQGYLQQVAQCTSIRTIALGEVKVVAEQCVDALQMFLGKSESKAEGDEGLIVHSLAVYSGNLVLAIKVQSTMQRSELDAVLRSLIY